MKYTLLSTLALLFGTLSSAEACTVLYKGNIGALTVAQQSQILELVRQVSTDIQCDLVSGGVSDYVINLGYYKPSSRLEGIEVYKDYLESESFFYVTATENGRSIFVKKNGLMLNAGAKSTDRGVRFFEKQLKKLSAQIKRSAAE